jgi:hypothetical protein
VVNAVWVSVCARVVDMFARVRCVHNQIHLHTYTDIPQNTLPLFRYDAFVNHACYCAASDRNIHALLGTATGPSLPGSERLSYVTGTVMCVCVSVCVCVN